MKKILLVAAVVVALAVLLVVSAVLLLPRFLDVNRYLPDVRAKAEEAIGRKVVIGSASVALFPPVTVTIDGLTIGGTPEEGGDLLRARKVRLGIALLPLLSKRVELRSVVLEAPAIRASRDREGRWTWQKLLPEGKTGAAGGAGEPAIRVGRVAIRGGAIRFRDESAGTRAPVELEFRDVDASASGLDGGAPWPVAVALTLPPFQGGRVSFKGRIGPPAEGEALPTVRGRLELERVDPKPFAAYLAKSPALRDLAGLLDADLALDLRAGAPASVKGTLGGKGVVLPGRAGKPLDIRVETDLTAATDLGKVEVRRLELLAAEWKLRGTGLYEKSGKTARLSLNLEPSRVRVSALRALLGEGGDIFPADLFRGDEFQAGGSVVAVFAERTGGFTLASLDVRDLRLSGADLLLRRDAAGAWNVPGGKPRPAASPAGAPEIRVSGASVDATRVRIEDAAVERGKLHVVELGDIRAKLGALEKGKAVPLELSARLGGEASGTIQAKGSVALDGPSDLRFEGKKVDLAGLAPWLRSQFGMNVARGVMTADATARGDLERGLALGGTLEIAGGKVVLPAEQGGKEIALDLSSRYDLVLSKGGKRVDARDLAIRLKQGEFGLSGFLESAPGGTALDLTLRPTRVSASDLVALAAFTGTKPPFGIESPEPLEVKGRLRRPAGGVMSVEGSLALREATVSHERLKEPLREVQGKLTFTGQEVALEGFSARLGGSDVSGWLGLRGFESPDVRFEMRSRHADLAELFSFVREPAAAPGTPAPAGEEGGVIGRARARGSLAIDEGSFGTLAFQGFTSQVALEKGVVRMDPLSMKAYGGGLSGTAEFDLSGKVPVYRIAAGMQGVDVNAFLSGNTEFKDGLFGTGTGEVSVQGRGTGLEPVVQSLEGTGRLDLRDGKVAKLDAFGMLAKVSGVFGERSLERLSRQMATEGTEFSRFGATFRVAGGRLLSDDLVIVTPDADLFGKGSTVLLTSTLDLDVRMVFSEEMSRAMQEEGSRAGELFWDDGKNRVILPVRLTGTLAEPKPGIDWGGAVQQAAKREAGRKVEDILGGILGRPKEEEKKKEAPAPAREPVPSAAGAEGDPVITIGEHRTSGNLLAPDLRIEGSFRGTDLAGATLEVKDERGKVRWRKDAFNEIEGYYAANPRDREAEIRFRVKVDGKEIAGAKELRVTVTLRDRAGRTATKSFTEKGGMKSLF